MMKLIWILILGLGLLTVGCKRDVESDEKKVEQILGDGNDYQELIRNPITADENMDTVNIAVAKFDEVSHDFGDIKARRHRDTYISFCQRRKSASSYKRCNFQLWMYRSGNPQTTDCTG